MINFQQLKKRFDFLHKALRRYGNLFETDRDDVQDLGLNSLKQHNKAKATSGPIVRATHKMFFVTAM